MGIDSPAPQGQRIVMAGMLISAIVAVIGCWLRWIEKGQEESINCCRRFKEYNPG